MMGVGMLGELPCVHIIIISYLTYYCKGNIDKNIITINNNNKETFPVYKSIL